ncbi:MAG: hypothetical protein RL279_848 [Pseudomonadota bacterium]
MFEAQLSEPLFKELKIVFNDCFSVFISTLPTSNILESPLLKAALK